MKISMIRYLLSLFSLFSLFSFLSFLPVHAEEANLLPFTVNPILPANQNKDTKWYFDLQTENGKTERLSFTIKNITNKPIEVFMEPTNALTSFDGEIQYLVHEGDDFAHLTDPAYYIKDQIFIQKSIPLKPYEEKTIPISVSVPKNGKGTYLGGILFTLLDMEEVVVDEKREGFVFKTDLEMALTVAVQLNLPTPDVPSVKFSEAGVMYYPSGLYSFVGLTNHSAAIVEDIQFTYKVFSEEKTLLFEGNIHSFNTAPKSFVKIPFAWNSKTMEQGNYTVEIEGTAGAQKISFQKEFVITEDFFKDYKERTGMETKTTFIVPWWIWLIAGIVLIAVILIGIFMKPGKVEENV